MAEEVHGARDLVVRRREQVGVFVRAVLPAARRSVELVTEGWRAGKFDLFRVINAARDEANARRDYLAALGALWQAAITLDRATGTP